MTTDPSLLAAPLVGDHVVDVPRVSPSTSVGECSEMLRGRSGEQADVVAVTEGDRLVGLISFALLLRVDPSLGARAVMTAPPDLVAQSAPAENAAQQAVAGGQSVIAV